MINTKEVLCEIIFKDHKIDVPTSRIGIINIYQLNKLSKNSNRFIFFKERYNSPILRSEIIEIIIHRDEKKISVDNIKSNIIKYVNVKDIGKIS
ncbi:MAG: hypothetical protein ACFFCE_02970 [Promethearchaeota archaeon]